MRSLLAHCRDDEAKIDTFRCSRCAWEYRIENPQAERVIEEDAWRATREFENHSCMDYRKPAA